MGFQFCVNCSYIIILICKADHILSLPRCFALVNSKYWWKWMQVFPAFQVCVYHFGFMNDIPVFANQKKSKDFHFYKKSHYCTTVGLSLTVKVKSYNVNFQKAGDTLHFMPFWFMKVFTGMLYFHIVGKPVLFENANFISNIMV